jgi:hypothetical protein
MISNSNTSEHKLQTIAVALSDTSFLKQNLYVEAKDVFDTDPNQWVWDSIRAHYRKLDELPTVSILEHEAKSIVAKDLLAAVNATLCELKKYADHPPTNIQWLKDQFNKLVEIQKLKNAMSTAADHVTTSPDISQKILRDYVNAPKHNDSVHQPQSITDFKRPDANDPNELIKFRFLSRQGACLLIGPSGVGKSTLATQMAISWGIGRPCVGFAPTAPLKSLIIQAEDDIGDIGEMCQSVLTGLGIEPGSDEYRTLSNNVKMVTLATACGDKFIEQLDSILASFRPDILWINPVLSFLGGDTNSQKDVSKFLRNGLNPLLHKYNTACVGVHHIAKPSKDKKNGWTGSDFQYAGLGSVEWTNWARCSLTIVSTPSPDVYILRAGKRGKRLGWKDPITDENTIDRYISHSKDAGVLYWTETEKDSIESITIEAKQSNATYNQLLKKIPFQPATITRQEVIGATGLGERTVDKYLKAMIASQLIIATKAGKQTIYCRAKVNPIVED